LSKVFCNGFVETGDLPACPEFVRACSTASVCD
jgi:hypothetical protein